MPALCLHKVCPRCGSQYENTRSTTCAQCFARLVPVDDTLAAELTAARAEVERTPEFKETKARDDDRFREQSFGACLVVVGLVIATLVIIMAVIGVSVQREHRKHRSASTAARPAPQAAAAVSANDILTARPVAGSPIGDVLPPDLGKFHRIAFDQDVVLPGTFTPIFHGTYSTGPAPPTTIQVYAIPTGRPTDEQNEFRLGVTLSSNIRAGASPPLNIFATEHWRYAAVLTSASGPGDALGEFKAAMAEVFGR